MCAVFTVFVYYVVHRLRQYHFLSHCATNFSLNNKIFAKQRSINSSTEQRNGIVKGLEGNSTNLVDGMVKEDKVGDIRDGTTDTPRYNFKVLI